MVTFHIKANIQGQYYLPKEVREELGKNLTLLCNTKAAIIFPENTSFETVLESMTLIKKDLEHRLQLKKTEDKNTKKNC